MAGRPAGIAILALVSGKCSHDMERRLRRDAKAADDLYAGSRPFSSDSSQNPLHFGCSAPIGGVCARADTYAQIKSDSNTSFQESNNAAWND